MSFREKIHTIIFGTDTRAGQLFDIILLWLILLSVLAVILESVPEFGGSIPAVFFLLDWGFAIIFTVEYLFRIYSAPERSRYIFSWWGIIDLLSIVPTYISVFVVGYHYLLVIRILRLLRVFRVLRLVRFTREGTLLLNALRASSYKIGVFISFMLTLVVLLSTLMYVVERGNPGFASIPSSIYWGIVTITTVGFGDIVPKTLLGKFITSITMICGYSIIAVPTGIVTVELSRRRNSEGKTDAKVCSNCRKSCGESDNFCSNCGKGLP